MNSPASCILRYVIGLKYDANGAKRGSQFVHKVYSKPRDTYITTARTSVQIALSQAKISHLSQWSVYSYKHDKIHSNVVLSKYVDKRKQKVHSDEIQSQSDRLKVNVTFSNEQSRVLNGN